MAAAGGAVAGIAAVASFGPLVRHEVRGVAERYGASVSVGTVLPGLGSVTLRGVDVSFAEIPAARLHFDEVAVGLFGGHRVAVRGGSIVAIGPRQVIAAQIEDYRARHRPNQEGGEGRGRELELHGVDLIWRDDAEHATQALTAVKIDLSRAAGITEVGSHVAIASFGPATVVAQGGHVVLARDQGRYFVRLLGADSVDAVVNLPSREGGADAAGAPAPAPAPDVTAAARVERARRSKDAGAPRGATPQSEGREGDVAARTMRASLVDAVAAFDRLLDPSAKLELPSVHAELRRGQDSLNLGPGSFGVRREPTQTVIELAPAGEGAAGQRLTFRVIVPRPESEQQEIVADIDGGPIGLAALGVHEGDLGLMRVSETSVLTKSHLVLSPDGRKLRLDGDGKITNLSIKNAALSDQPVMGMELAWRAKGEVALDGSALHLDDAELDVGAVRLVAHGTIDGSSERRVVRTEFEVPMTSCQSALDAVPRGLVPKLQGMKIAGSFAIKGHARFDTARLDNDYDVRWNATNSCRVVEVPSEIDVARFKQPFHRVAYTPEGDQIDIEVGPGTPGWTPYGAISKFMEAAILTTEDGGFFRHHGFDDEAIRNSIRENLKAKKFVRGASTVTMQLSRNIYLDRKKNLSRKVQESVLTMYLEQALTKEEIMELYLNVIEFGPMIYGVGPAAQHYFSVDASELTLSQSLYLSSILPNPKQQHFAASGEVTASWSSYLRKLMRTANKRNRINDQELEDGLRETAIRGSPSPRRDATAPKDEDSGGPDELGR